MARVIDSQAFTPRICEVDVEIRGIGGGTMGCHSFAFCLGIERRLRGGGRQKAKTPVSEISAHVIRSPGGQN